MASTHIEVPATASRLSADYRQLIDLARRLQDTTEHVVDITETVKTGDDWPALAAKLGVTAAEAQTVYGLVTAFQTVINKPAYDAFIDRLG